MTEIGGYFELDDLIHQEYYPDFIALNTCRNALLYVIKAKKIKKIYIPYYLCDCISEMLSRNNICFVYYHTGKNFLPVFDKKLPSEEYMLVVNYYGQITHEKVMQLQEQYGNIILDNTQAFFQEPLPGIDTIYSCRKFFGVPDGAYLSTDTFLNEELPVDISKDRMKHILGRYEGTASEYYEDFKNNDKALAAEPIKQMSRLTHNILGALDYEKICNRRNENFQYLHDSLGQFNKLKISPVEGAFAYPFYVENGIEIKRTLAHQGIYIPTLWPNVMEQCPEEESTGYIYAGNILPLPCDQRYQLNNMDQFVRRLLPCINFVK